MVYILKHISQQYRGTIIVDGVESQTTCCVHCRKHWVIRPGSGKRRGYCFNCSGPVCGSKECETCVPYEKSIELIEKRAREKAN